MGSPQVIATTPGASVSHKDALALAMWVAAAVQAAPVAASCVGVPPHGLIPIRSTGLSLGCPPSDYLLRLPRCRCIHTGHIVPSVSRPAPPLQPASLLSCLPPPILSWGMIIVDEYLKSTCCFCRRRGHRTAEPAAWSKIRGLSVRDTEVCRTSILGRRGYEGPET